MTTNERELLVRAERCIGCRACTVVCPASLITLRDTDRQRTLRFAAVCGEDCVRCAEACPTEAISLGPAAAVVPQEARELSFEMQACRGCGAPVATVEALAWLRAAIPAQVQSDAAGQRWLELCPRCRQEVEAEQVAREAMMTREGV